MTVQEGSLLPLRVDEITVGLRVSFSRSLRHRNRTTGVCGRDAAPDLQQAPVEPREQRVALEADFEGRS